MGSEEGDKSKGGSDVRRRLGEAGGAARRRLGAAVAKAAVKAQGSVAAVKGKYAKVVKDARHQRDKVQSSMRKVMTGDGNKRVRDAVRIVLSKELQTSRGVKLKDKLSFVIGVLLVVISEFVWTMYPGYFKYWYLATIVPMLMFRYFHYRSLKWEYFLLDMCYFANLLCIIFIVAFPTSMMLFQIAFALTDGPVMWAILAWRNSLVFHDLDKVTSLFIHAAPSILMHCLRWSDPDMMYIRHTQWSWYTTFFPVMAAYFCWQVFYVLKTDIADAPKFKDDPKLMTSIRWFSTSKKGMLYAASRAVSRKLGVLGPKDDIDGDTWTGKMIFMTSQLVYTFATLAPLHFLYNDFTVHTVILLVVLTSTVWFGANFYIEIFANRYSESILTTIKMNQARHQRLAEESARRRADMELRATVGDEDDAPITSHSSTASLSSTTSITSDDEDDVLGWYLQAALDESYPLDSGIDLDAAIDGDGDVVDAPEDGAPVSETKAE